MQEFRQNWGMRPIVAEQSFAHSPRGYANSLPYPTLVDSLGTRELERSFDE